jgi:hypothetical protein
MKPRDLLLERHKSVEPKLDAVRKSALATALYAPCQETEQREDWREWLRPVRWHLLGLAAAWLLVALLNHNASTTTAAPLPSVSVSAPHDIVAIRENRLQLLQLLEPAGADAPPVPSVPRRRGQLQSTNAAA